MGHKKMRVYPIIHKKVGKTSPFLQEKLTKFTFLGIVEHNSRIYLIKIGCSRYFR